MSTVKRVFALDFPNRPDPEGGAVEYLVGTWFVHATGGQPVQADIDGYLSPSAEQQRIAAFKADPTRANLITLIQGSTPAQVNTWLTNNVTNLAQARAVLGQLILLAGGNSIS